MTFRKWLMKLNKAVEAAGGPASYDMPPLDYRDLYDDGKSIEEVVKLVLAAA